MNEYNRHDYAGRPTRSALVTDGEALIVPAAITRKITPEISKTALMTIEDERRYHAQKGVG